MGVRGDQQIVHADRLASRFQLSVDAAIFGVSQRTPPLAH